MIGEDILYLSVRELSAQIRSRKLSPVELTESYLGRSETIGKRLNAYATVTRDLALKEAREAEREIRSGRYRGPLHGIPYAAKDLLAVNGYPTTWGARPFLNQKFDFDATVIKKLREAGAILIGKAAMIELAGGMGYRFASASASGAARNPWDETCWTCGSSSGSGAIAASALAAFAIGTETWGSIVCPSSFCGVSGLRPTYGRVSRHGAMALSYSMDKIGPMGRTADDCGLVLSVIAGHDPEDPASLQDAEFKYSVQASAQRMKLGLLTNAWDKPLPDVEQIIKEAIAALRSSGPVSVEDAKLPEGPWEAAAGTIISVEGAAAFEPLLENGRIAELNDPLGRIGGYVSQQIPATDYYRATRIRRVLQRRIDELFDRFDVLVAASLPVTASKLTANLETELSFSDPLGAIGNLCGLPAQVVPCGFASNGMPVGLEFLGRPLEENNVIAAARLFQHHTDWHRKRPPVGAQ
jgi:aspartyl-tRNA(Asn)/glutamyl-tRNA(Gln) amidotransferase subunit A